MTSAPVLTDSPLLTADDIAPIRTRRRLLRPRWIMHVVIVVLLVVWFTPVLALFVSSIRTQRDNGASGWWNAFITPRLTAVNYREAFNVVGVGDSIATSLAIAIPTTVMTTAFCALGAFALTRMRFAGRTALSILLVALLVVPPQVTLVPLLQLFGNIGVGGSVVGVWIYQVGFTLPFGIFLLRGFIAGIPRELFESASLDGASPLRTFRSVVLPLSVPVLMSLAILSFLWSWNDLLIPLLFLGGSDLSAPITVQVAGLVQTTGQGEGTLMAATFISVVIPLLIIVTMQRYFVRGILGGAVKGMSQMQTTAAEPTRTGLSRSQVALNAIQWINLKAPPGEAPIWRYTDPTWRAEQPAVHRAIRDAGFDAVMMEVLDTQTLQTYRRVLDDSGLRPAPGYVQISPPELTGRTLTRGSADWVRWFDPVRRRAEESNFFGLSTVFLAAEMILTAPRVVEATATGHGFDQDLLARQTEYLADAAEVLRGEGIHPGLHNHVGSLIETQREIEYVLDQIDNSVLGASFDIGHLEWVGIDSPAFLSRYADRLVDVHVKDLDLGIAAASRATPTSYYDVADQRFFLEPGLGDIDLPAVLAALGDHFDGWIVIEVDRASMEPEASARFSWQWVEQTFPEA